MDEKRSLEKQPEPRPERPVAEADVRASDADRDRIAEILREALAEGRLDTEEHAERIDAVYRAKTMGELAPLVRDLPAGRREALRPDPTTPRPASAPSPHGYGAHGGENLVAVFSSASRKGRWRVGGRLNAFALFGSVEIDLSEALFDHRQVVVNATSVFGSVEIKVPENVTLHGSGTGVLGSYEVKSLESDDPEAPMIVVRGAAVLGSVEAKPKRGKRGKRLRGR